MKKLIILFLVASAAIKTQAQEVEFKMDLPLNQPLKAVTTMKMDIDGEQAMIMDIVTKSTITATALEANNYTLENVTDAVKMDMDAGMMTMSYDSENPSEDDPMSAMLGAQMESLIGKTVTIITSDKGELVSSSSDEEDDEEMNNGFENLAMTAVYPDKPVKPGDSWTTETSANGMTTKAVNKFVGSDQDGHQLETSGELFDGDDNQIGTVNGTYTVDSKTFYTKHANLKMEMEVEGQKIITDVLMDIEN